MARWNVNITNFHGGFAPSWYNSGDYPTYGNKNHAAAMTNIDLTAAGVLTQGPGLADLTNGTQAGAVTTLINSIVDRAVSSDKTYAIGGTEVYEISSTACTNTGSFPYTITAASGTAVGEDVAHYNGALYYTYNYTGAGDIGKYDLSSTFDDDWGSTTPSGAATLEASVPHPMCVAGNDNLYIANGNYVASYDGTTLIPQALDLPSDTVVEDMHWNADRLFIFANRPDISGNNKNKASVYIWDGTTNSWEAEVTVMGTIGGGHVKNGVLFVFYQDITSTGGYKLGYVSGGTIKDLANYTGSLPDYGQITDYKDFLMWVSSGAIWAYGAGSVDLPVRLFQLADGGHTTVGALACPFGTPLVASWDDSTNYRCAKFSGYDTNCSYKSLVFDVTASTGLSAIEQVVFMFDTLGANARVDWSLVNSNGVTIYSDTISNAKAAASTPQHTYTTASYNLNKLKADNFRVELDFSNGDTTNPVKIRGIKIFGDSEQAYG